MSKRTEPAAIRPYSIEAASVGSRLASASGRGREVAALLWFAVLSHTPWDSAARPTWACNLTLAADVGMDGQDDRQTERGLKRLRDAGMLTTHHGKRPGARRRFGRVLVPKLSAPVKVLIPKREEMARLWIECRRARPRPAALVTAMVGAHVLAAHALGHRPLEWSPVTAKAADLRRFVGASKGSTWGRRVNDLCDLGLLERRSCLWIAPPSEW